MKRSLCCFVALCVSGLLASCGGSSGNNCGGGCSQLATHFSVTTPQDATVGTPFSFTVTALDSSNAVAKSYAGMMYFASTDGHAVLACQLHAGKRYRNFLGNLQHQRQSNHHSNRHRHRNNHGRFERHPSFHFSASWQLHAYSRQHGLPARRTYRDLATGRDSLDRRRRKLDRTSRDGRDLQPFQRHVHLYLRQHGNCKSWAHSDLAHQWDRLDHRGK